MKSGKLENRPLYTCCFLNLCEEYLNVIKFKTSVLLQIKYWTFVIWIIFLRHHPSHIRVTNFKKSFSWPTRYITNF